MKKSIILITVLTVLPFLFISCDYGVNDGKDLVGKWMNPYNYYCEYITFHEDNTGYHELRESDREMTAKDFEWDVVQGQYYKTVKTDIGDYEYYFNAKKDYLYMRLSGKCCFSTWMKFRNY